MVLAKVKNCKAAEILRWQAALQSSAAGTHPALTAQYPGVTVWLEMTSPVSHPRDPFFDIDAACGDIKACCNDRAILTWIRR